MPIFSQFLEDLVAVVEGCRHQVWRFIAGETKHYALIARTFIFIAARIDALCNMR